MHTDVRVCVCVGLWSESHSFSTCGIEFVCRKIQNNNNTPVVTYHLLSCQDETFETGIKILVALLMCDNVSSLASPPFAICCCWRAVEEEGKRWQLCEKTQANNNSVACAECQRTMRGLRDRVEISAPLNQCTALKCMTEALAEVNLWNEREKVGAAGQIKLFSFFLKCSFCSKCGEIQS